MPHRVTLTFQRYLLPNLKQARSPERKVASRGSAGAAMEGKWRNCGVMGWAREGPAYAGQVQR